MSITEEQLAELERLEREATPGPWRWWTSNSHTRLGTPDKDEAVAFGYASRADGVGSIAILLDDMNFIVAARSALPQLLAEVRRLKEENAAPLRHGAAEERAKIVKWLTLHGQLSLAKFIERGEAGE